jgi:LysR family transcriptional regulator, cys regulon transcriptional activator
MNFQQLRIVRETVRRNFNLTEVADALATSQPGVSRHIKDLEQELGVELYVRKGKRLLGLTEPGQEVAVIVERLLHEAANLKTVAERYTLQDQGVLTIATTHTQARYTLPPVVSRFKTLYPDVHLMLHQGSPAEISQMLLAGEADVAMATEKLADVEGLAAFPFYSWHHAVVVPAGHPLEQLSAVSLADIAEYPLITYHEGFTGRGLIDQAFADADLEPDVVISALDADVIKSYVELGHGVGIIASMAFNPERDSELRMLDCSHLFAEVQSLIALRRGRLLRRYAYRFVELCAPSLTEQMLTGILAGSSDSPP